MKIGALRNFAEFIEKRGEEKGFIGTNGLILNIVSVDLRRNAVKNKEEKKEEENLKLVSSIFKIKNVLLGYFERIILKRNLSYSCFIFPLFHEHSFSLELPCVAGFLKTFF